MSNLPPMRPLKFWTQKILPLIYDDSLSYLEMLGKVKSKLNELINYYNTLKDEIPQEAQGMYEEISARLEADLQTAINSLDDVLSANINDLNFAKNNAISQINEAADEAKQVLDQYALEEVQQIIADYDSALAPLLTPSATATTLAPGAAPTASYNNGVFTFGLPGNAGDMTVAEYGGSEPGVVAEADNAKSLNNAPASDYMKKADYTGNGTQKVKAAQTADNSTNLGGSPANDYMKKADYAGSSAGSVALANNSSRLAGHLSSYYATAEQMQQANQDILTLNQLVSEIDVTDIKNRIKSFWMQRSRVAPNQTVTFTFSDQAAFVLVRAGTALHSSRYIDAYYCATTGFEKTNGSGDDYTIITTGFNMTITNNSTVAFYVGMFGYYGNPPVIS